MKKLFAALLLILLATPAFAAPAPSIVVVDVQKILRESTATKGIREQLEAKRNTYQAEIKKEEERLRAAEQDLIKNRTTLSKEALIQKQKALRQDFAGVERKVMARRKALDMGFADAMKQVRSALAEIVVNTAKTQSANIVLPKEGTMWIAPELEITDTVLSQLNTKLPKVTVTIQTPKT